VVVWCGTEAGAVCGISVTSAGVCAVIGAGAGVVKGLKEQAVLRWGGGWFGYRGEGAGSGGAGGLVLHERVGQLNRGGVVWLCWRSGCCLDGVRMADGQVV